MTGQQMFVKFCEMYEERYSWQGTYTDQDAKQFAYMMLASYAAALGNTEADQHFQKRAFEMNPNAKPL